MTQADFNEWKARQVEDFHLLVFIAIRYYEAFKN